MTCLCNKGVLCLNLSIPLVLFVLVTHTLIGKSLFSSTIAFFQDCRKLASRHSQRLMHQTVGVIAGVLSRHRAIESRTSPYIPVITENDQYPKTFTCSMLILSEIILVRTLTSPATEHSFLMTPVRKSEMRAGEHKRFLADKYQTIEEVLHQKQWQRDSCCPKVRVH